MAALVWAYGTGPATTQELADEVEREKRLGVFSLNVNGLRSLWGVIYDIRADARANVGRDLTEASMDLLHDNGVTINDPYQGTPEERCVEMARRLRAIP